jgi:predicted ABC-type ATPase
MKPILLKNIISRLRESTISDSKLKEVVDIIQTKCDVEHLFDSGSPMYYRGMSSNEPIITVDPTQKERKSKDSTNASLTFFSTSDAWAKLNIPRRNRSIIFASRIHTAKEYGMAYAVFPIGNPYVGYGTSPDNYDNFDKSMQNITRKSHLGTHAFFYLARTVESVDELIGKFGQKFLGTGDRDFSMGQEAMKESLQTIEDYSQELNKLSDTEFLEKLEIDGKKYYGENFELNGDDRSLEFYRFMRAHGGFFNLLNKIYDPEVNKIQANLLSELPKMASSVEMWTEGSCILIGYDLIKDWSKFYGVLTGEITLEKYLNQAEETEEISEDLIKEGPRDPHIFKAIFTAGLPGSGKTTIIKSLTTHTGLKTVNFDEIYEFLKSHDTDNLDQIEKSNNLLDKKMKLFIDGRLGMIIDRTSWNYSEIQSTKKMLENLGYECMMVYVNTDLNVAKRRAMDRFHQTGRNVDSKYIDMVFEKLHSNLGKYQQDFSNKLVIIDNSTVHNVEPLKIKFRGHQNR